MHMIKWMVVIKSRGVNFSFGGNPKPVVFYDASNKPDETDGKCAYGVTMMWFVGSSGFTEQETGARRTECVPQ